MNNTKIKRLSIDLDIVTHNHIKKIAADKNISMRIWILEAIAEKIKKDFNLGFE